MTAVEDSFNKIKFWFDASEVLVPNGTKEIFYTVKGFAVIESTSGLSNIRII